MASDLGIKPNKISKARESLEIYRKALKVYKKSKKVYEEAVAQAWKDYKEAILIGGKNLREVLKNEEDD